MTGSRPGRVWGLVASQAAGRGGRVSAADVCAAAVAAVEVTGAWLSAARGAEAGHLMRVTDEVSEQLAELHLTLGQGPCLDAAASGGPVLASDLAGGESGRRWPVFALAARQAGAAAIFAFPLRIGAIRAGVLGLYRERPGPLTAFQLGDALIFADAATLLLLDAQDQAGGDLAALAGPGGQPADLALRRAEIDQTTGMLTEQLGAGIGDAFARLRGYAATRLCLCLGGRALPSKHAQLPSALAGSALSRSRVDLPLSGWQTISPESTRRLQRDPAKMSGTRRRSVMIRKIHGMILAWHSGGNRAQAGEPHKFARLGWRAPEP
jgi:GAF domain